MIPLALNGCLPRDAVHSADYGGQDICPFVCPFVCPSHAGIVSKG